MGLMVKVNGSGKARVVLQGLDGYCVVDTGDVLLICEKEKEQELKQITLDLKVADLDKYL